MKRVFLVEDELLVALVYTQFLTKKGFEIVGPFTTGKSALDELDTSTICAALLDISLDDSISGIDIAEHIRKSSNIPIVFTTGNDTRKTEAQVSHLGNTFILPKPVDLKELLKIIED